MSKLIKNASVSTGYLCVAIAMVVGGAALGCAHHHHDDRVVVMDEHGYRHEGNFDADHHWHGGWYDEHNVYHEDPADWHH